MIRLYAKIELPDDSILKINRSNMLSISDNISDRAEIDRPSYGLISNNASLSFRISKEQMSNLISIGATTRKLRCVIYIENTLSKLSESVGTKYTEKWNYDTAKQVATVSLVDDLTKAQSENVTEKPMRIAYPENIAGTHPFWHYFYPSGAWGERYSDGSWAQTEVPSSELIIFGKVVKITEAARKVLERTTAEFYYVSQASSWGYYEDLAQALQLHIYIGKGEQLIIDYQGGA